MTGIALAVLVAIVVVARQLGSRAWAVALGLLLGGAIGNLTDRFVRAPGRGQGHVVDFIDYNRWFIGNVADIAIVVGGRHHHRLLASASASHASPRPRSRVRGRPPRATPRSDA